MWIGGRCSRAACFFLLFFVFFVFSFLQAKYESYSRKSVVQALPRCRRYSSNPPAKVLCEGSGNAGGLPASVASLWCAGGHVGSRLICTKQLMMFSSPLWGFGEDKLAPASIWWCAWGPGLTCCHVCLVPHHFRGSFLTQASSIPREGKSHNWVCQQFLSESELRCISSTNIF